MKNEIAIVLVSFLLTGAFIFGHRLGQELMQKKYDEMYMQELKTGGELISCQNRERALRKFWNAHKNKAPTQSQVFTYTGGGGNANIDRNSYINSTDGSNSRMIHSRETSKVFVDMNKLIDEEIK